MPKTDERGSWGIKLPVENELPVPIEVTGRCVVTGDDVVGIEDLRVSLNGGSLTPRQRVELALELLEHVAVVKAVQGAKSLLRSALRNW